MQPFCKLDICNIKMTIFLSIFDFLQVQILLISGLKHSVQMNIVTNCHQAAFKQLVWTQEKEVGGFAFSVQSFATRAVFYL